jgi:hypothetical protein
MRISRFLLALAASSISIVPALAAAPAAPVAAKAAPLDTAAILKHMQALQAQLAALEAQVKAASATASPASKKAAAPAAPAKKLSQKVDMQPGWVVSVYPAGQKATYSVGSYIQHGSSWRLNGYIGKTPWKNAAILHADGFYKATTSGPYTFFANITNLSPTISDLCGLKIIANGSVIAKSQGTVSRNNVLSAVGGATLKPGLYQLSVRTGCNPNDGWNGFYNQRMEIKIFAKAPNNNNPHLIGDSDIFHKIQKGGKK